MSSPIIGIIFTKFSSCYNFDEVLKNDVWAINYIIQVLTYRNYEIPRYWNILLLLK